MKIEKIALLTDYHSKKSGKPLYFMYLLFLFIKISQIMILELQNI